MTWFIYTRHPDGSEQVQVWIRKSRPHKQAELHVARNGEISALAYVRAEAESVAMRAGRRVITTIFGKSWAGRGRVSEE